LPGYAIGRHAFGFRVDDLSLGDPGDVKLAGGRAGKCGSTTATAAGCFSSAAGKTVAILLSVATSEDSRATSRMQSSEDRAVKAMRWIPPDLARPPMRFKPDLAETLERMS
jgi:hypothetical protein